MYKGCAMNKSDKAAMQLALDWMCNHGGIVFAGGGMNAVDPMNKAAQALRAAIAQPTALQPLTDQSIDAMWSNEKLTLPQLVNRRVIARAVEAAHAIAPPADLLQEDGVEASNLPIEDSPQG